jgi:hypothetical protein
MASDSPWSEIEPAKRPRQNTKFHRVFKARLTVQPFASKYSSFSFSEIEAFSSLTRLGKRDVSADRRDT